MDRQTLFWALGSALFAALTAVFAKLGLKQVDSDFASLVRTWLIGLLLVPFVIATGKWVDPFSLSRTTWLFLLLSALATGASWVCYFRALSLGNASQVGPVDKLSVVLVAILSVFVLGERPTAREWVGIGCIALGVLLVSWKR